MNGNCSRRVFLGALSASLAGCAVQSRQPAEPTHAFLEIERRIGGRLGLYALATDSRDVLCYRANERFAMCSTFKWVLAAAVLSQVDQGKLTLHQPIEYSAKDLLDYAPLTRVNVEKGSMTLEELTCAAVTVSDNTAANLLLERLGGPLGLTHFLRAHGDTVTRLDRNEPSLNSNEAGDLRDTTSPQAMVSNLRTLLTTSALSPTSRERIVNWMVASPTGRARLRAGLPATWRAGDKTGTGGHGAVNDVAIAWPPGRAPVLVALYLSESSSPLPTLVAAHAEIGRIVASSFA